MGGIAVNLKNETSISRLYAIGETASTGVHGANRLASNSLLECIVFAENFRHLSFSEEINEVEFPTICQPLSIPDNYASEMEIISSIRQKLPAILWEGAGICRTAKGLNKAIAQVEHWQTESKKLAIVKLINELHCSTNYTIDNTDIEQALRLVTETMNLLDVGELILKGALYRTESRGGHYRLDYPQTDENWQKHTTVKGYHWQTSK